MYGELGLQYVLGQKRNLQYGDFLWKPEGKGLFGRPRKKIGDKMKVNLN